MTRKMITQNRVKMFLRFYSNDSECFDFRGSQKFEKLSLF